jgi:NitT/TauT family transport system permease protein
MPEAISTRAKEAESSLRKPEKRSTGSIITFPQKAEERSTTPSRFSSVIANLKTILDAYSGVWLVLIFLGLWEALPRLGIVDQVYLPTFSETMKTLVHLLISGKIFTDIGVSCLRALTGFVLAALVAIPLGFLMGWYNRFERYTDLFIQTLRNTSTFALFPIFLLLFGLGETSKIAIIFYASSWHMLINTINGVKNVDPIYIKAAKSMGVTDRELFRKVILPASIPSIVAGARLGVKIAFMVVVAAEMIGAKSGLGFFIQSSQYNFMIPQMYAGVVMLSLLGVAINYILVWFEKKTTSWKGEIDQSING